MSFRHLFHIPQQNGKDVIYFCGNSLGLQPKQTSAYIQEVLLQWQKNAVEAHFMSPNAWLHYHTLSQPILAQLTGANPSEVVATGTLTANLHFLLATFYRPTQNRYKILCEKGAFPSDRYALVSQIQWHGFSPENALIEVGNTDNNAIPNILSTSQIEDAIEKHADSIALILFAGVQYATGQYFDIQAITRKAHSVGAYAGFDLAHAIGNVPLRLHDWQVDFACWCSYKYLNAGPGGVGGLFVHQNTHLKPRLAGWWGHDLSTRFAMPADFIPEQGAQAWQVSNAPVLQLAALQASLDIFHQVGFDNLLQKSRQLTAYLQEKIISLNQKYQTDLIRIITPLHPNQRGCQLSISVNQNAKKLHEYLNSNGVICDWREPNIIRLTPVPLYNSFEDIDQAYQILDSYYQQI